MSSSISIYVCGDEASWEGYAQQMLTQAEEQRAEEERLEDISHEEQLYEREPEYVNARLTVDPYAPEPHYERTEVEYVDAVFCAPTIAIEHENGERDIWPDMLGESSDAG